MQTKLDAINSVPPSLIFQAGKLVDIPQLVDELAAAKELLQSNQPIGRIYGISGGSLTAAAFALAFSARLNPQSWSWAADMLDDLSSYLTGSPGWKKRRYNFNPRFGLYNLKPLRRWLERNINGHSSEKPLMISELPVDLYIGAADRDGLLTLFGKPDNSLQLQYHFLTIHPPQDAPLVDALIAAVSTLLTTEPALVNGAYYRDCRPILVDTGALISDLEGQDPRKILRSKPYISKQRLRNNVLTSSFIMHAHHQQNAVLLSLLYLDLKERHRLLETALKNHTASISTPSQPNVFHVQLPYIGSTEAATNMRQSVEQKDQLIQRFTDLLAGQLDDFPFDTSANLIYGAGGFSGILAGLVAARRISAGFQRGGGQVNQIYGISAGVINGFFHAVQLAAGQHPHLYTPAAQSALNDLEAFIADIKAEKVVNVNRNPLRLWKGLANLAPFEAYLEERLKAYTGCSDPQSLTFNDISLPLTVCVAREDGFTDFLGMTTPERRTRLNGREIKVLSAPVIRSIIAGWSMNTYIEPTRIGDQLYTDAGGTFYDIGIFPVCLDPELRSLINIHLDEPEGHSYNLPNKPDLLRILFDTHNYTFPEERRRMYYLTNLLYRHYQLRLAVQEHAPDLAQNEPISDLLQDDFCKDWNLINRTTNLYQWM